MSEGNANPSMPDLSGIMDIISKNPELVEKAASILDGIKNGGDAPPIPGFDPSALGAILPAFKPTSDGKKDGGGRGHHGRNRSCELLRALKPYLSKERCDAIDYMLNFSKIGDLLGAIAPNGNKGGEDV
jgi:hypothetical protein